MLSLSHSLSLSLSFSLSLSLSLLQHLHMIEKIAKRIYTIFVAICDAFDEQFSDFHTDANAPENIELD